ASMRLEAAGPLSIIWKNHNIKDRNRHFVDWIPNVHTALIFILHPFVTSPQTH
ncbi:Flagellar transcriptional regulator FlhC, partial [Clarias magur]